MFRSRSFAMTKVLIKVRRAGVCGTDVHIYDWDAWAQGRCPSTIHGGT
jgi:threonine 3-dehydrogenase